jgi:hypothetical protein
MSTPQTMIIKPADKYRSCEEICVITSFFNPAFYHSKIKNYCRFRESFAGCGIPLYTVELAYDNQPFQLSELSNILQVRSSSPLWQKERLLNILLNDIPPKFRKIAWLDCDILFENANWANETSTALDHAMVVQPFEYVIKLPPDKQTANINSKLFEVAVRLPRNGVSNTSSGEVFVGFNRSLKDDYTTDKKKDWYYHGHTGYAWAARRDFLAEAGLYDVCLSGIADHLMAHAFTGNWDCQCVDMLIKSSDVFKRHYFEWSRKAFSVVNASLDCVPGSILHLWHGKTENRNYFKRSLELMDMNFNPSEDLICDGSGLWLVGDQNSRLNEWSLDYFKSRLEDE